MYGQDAYGEEVDGDEDKNDGMNALVRICFKNGGVINMYRICNM
jgi:hypothetical protein